MNRARIRPGEGPELASESTNAPVGDPEAVRRKYLAEIPARQRSIFLQAWSGRSRKAAIRAACIECMGFQSAEVNRCTRPACALFPYREDRL